MSLAAMFECTPLRVAFSFLLKEELSVPKEIPNRELSPHTKCHGLILNSAVLTFCQARLIPHSDVTPLLPGTILLHRAEEELGV